MRKLASQTQSFSLFHNEKSPAGQVLTLFGLGTALQRCDGSLEKFFHHRIYNICVMIKFDIGENCAIFVGGGYNKRMKNE